MTQPGLFDDQERRRFTARREPSPPPEAVAATVEAIEQVQQPKPAQVWMAEALPVLKALCLRKPEVTGDDLWREVRSPPEPRASGPLWVKARKLGWIEPTGQVIASSRRERHTGSVKVWRSLIHGS